MEGLHKRANATVALLDTTARDAIFAKDLATLESFVQHAIANRTVSFIRIQETDGTVLAQAGEQELLDYQDLRTPDTIDSALDDGVYDAQVAVIEGGRTYAYIEIGLSTQYAEDAKKAARNRNLIIAGTELLLVALFSILLGRYLTRELLRMKTATAAIAAGEFGIQVPVTGHDEIADTLRSFNEMSLQIEKFYEQQKASEQREFEGRTRLSGILATISEGVVLLNDKMVVEYANPIGHSFLGFLCENHTSGHPMGHIGDVPLQQLLSASRPPTRELTVSIQSSERVFEFSAVQVDHNAPFMEWVFVLRDVTQSRQSLEKAKKNARLAAIGQLSAGIAHDFNNILSVIIGLSDLNLSRTAEELDDDLRKDLECILEQGLQASELVRHVLDFSRKERTNEDTPIELNAFLDSLVSLLARTTPKTATIKFEPTKEQLWIRFNTTQLQQVVTNIIMNAVDALHKTGEITLQVEMRSTDKEGGKSKTSTWICLAISDNGEGISNKDLPHIFEPFYTTKALGKGTGLGLAQAYELMEKYEGRLEVDTEIGIGTCFTLYFNEMKLQPTAFPEYGEDNTETNQIFAKEFKGKRILLIDDDEQVRKAIKAMLIRLECVVLEAKNGQEGLKMYAENRDALDAILSDVLMPLMGGAEMVVRLRQHEQCNIPIALLSGYIPEDEVDVEELSSYINGFLPKPIIFDTLTTFLGRLFAKTTAPEASENSPTAN